ncbi:MAG: TPM domain-containing protein [bacterium]
MRNRFLSIYFSLFALLFSFSVAHALQIPPKPEGRVSDYAGMLDAASRGELEQKLKDFEDATSNQVIVAIFPSLEGESLEDFSIHLADRWKVGQKGRDNGVILLIFKNDRQLRIETGYGLEGALPDAVGKSIIQDVIVPRFKEGDFKGGIFAGVDAIFEATKGEYHAKPHQDGLPLPPWVVILLIFFLFMLFNYLAKRAGGGRGIGTFSSGGFSGGWSSGSDSSWSSSSGSDFSGGGGSFGGGGASGSW